MARCYALGATPWPASRSEREHNDRRCRRQQSSAHCPMNECAGEWLRRCRCVVCVVLRVMLAMYPGRKLGRFLGSSQQNSALFSEHQTTTYLLHFSYANRRDWYHQVRGRHVQLECCCIELNAARAARVCIAFLVLCYGGPLDDRPIHVASTPRDHVEKKQGPERKPQRSARAPREASLTPEPLSLNSVGAVNRDTMVSCERERERVMLRGPCSSIFIL